MIMDGSLRRAKCKRQNVPYKDMDQPGRRQRVSKKNTNSSLKRQKIATKRQTNIYGNKTPKKDTKCLKNTKMAK